MTVSVCYREWVSRALLFLVISGCGGSNAPPLCKISGKVMSQGRPVTQGEVSFMSEEGFGVSAPIDPQGNYSLRSHYGNGIPVGTYKVVVTPPAQEINESAPPARTTPKDPYPGIPKKYREFSTSGLQFTIEQGTQTFDLTLDE